MDQSRIAVLLTSHNRRESTLQCLRSLHRATPPPLSLDVFLVDDASTDGTSEAVLREFPATRVVPGTGSLYWNTGMRVAFDTARIHGYDYYVWLNDDTVLYPTALEKLLETHENLRAQNQPKAIVVGAIEDGNTGALTYGGVVRRGWLWRRFDLIRPSTASPIPCDTMNGNCVLIPKAVAEAVQPNDVTFRHAFGDYDFGLRAGAAGVSIWVAAGVVGTCRRNSEKGTWRDPDLHWRLRYRNLKSPKGLPAMEWFTFCKRHLGIAWPLRFMSPYAKFLASVVLAYLTRRQARRLVRS